MNRKDFYKTISDDTNLHDQILSNYKVEVYKVIESIKSRDKLMNPDVEDSGEVVDIEAITIPLLAALLNAHYQGMFTQLKRSE